MRVLVLLDHSIPAQQALWEEVARRDVDLHVGYTLAVPCSAEIAPPEAGTTHELAAVGLRGDRRTWMAYRGVRALVGTVRPDLVHVLNEPWSVVALQATHAGAPHVVVQGIENLWDQGGAPEVRARRLLTRHNLRRSSGFVSWNTQGAAWSRQWGLRSTSPTLVLCAEPPRLERFRHPERRRSEGRGQWGLGEDEFVVGYVGRLVAEKGLDWLLASWKAAALADNARLVFVGQGPLEPVIRSAAATDDRIRLVGPVPLDHVPSVMASLDALVLPSRTTKGWSEQYGRVITEAMASGVPVIASDSGAIPEVVGDAGILVREGSVEELAAGLARVGSDPAERERLRRAGYARAEVEFSPRQGADRLVAFWDEVQSARS